MTADINYFLNIYLGGDVVEMTVVLEATDSRSSKASTKVKYKIKIIWPQFSYAYLSALEINYYNNGDISAFLKEKFWFSHRTK